MPSKSKWKSMYHAQVDRNQQNFERHRERLSRLNRQYYELGVQYRRVRHERDEANKENISLIMSGNTRDDMNKTIEALRSDLRASQSHTASAVERRDHYRMSWETISIWSARVSVLFILSFLFNIGQAILFWGRW